MDSDHIIAKYIDDQIELLWKQFEMQYYKIIPYRPAFSNQTYYISNKYFVMTNDVQHHFKQTQQYKQIRYFIYMAPVLYENDLLPLFQDVLDPEKVLRVPEGIVQTSTINF